MRKVEYLRAFEDNTWDTIIVEVPSFKEDPKHYVEDFNDFGKLIDYANEVLLVQAQHRKVVLFAVYRIL